MKTLIGLWIAFALVTTGAQVQKAEKALTVVAEQDRHVAGGRAVQVALRQARIATTIEMGRVANSGYSNSLFSALVIDSIDVDVRDTIRQSLREKAEALAMPLRQTLGDFDVHALALTTTRAALAKPDWLQAREIFSILGAPSQAALLASTDAAQLVFIDYRYELSHDFSQIRVLAEITLIKRPEANDRKSGTSQAIYRQRILSVVQLRERSYEPRENVTRWSAERGKLARAALTAAFGQFEQLIPYALGLGQKDIDAFTAKKQDKTFAAGFYGPLIARSATNPEDILIWAGGLVHVQSVP